MHRIVRVVRHDVLVLRLDPGKELENETTGVELIADESRSEGILAVEGGGQVDAIVE